MEKKVSLNIIVTRNIVVTVYKYASLREDVTWNVLHIMSILTDPVRTHQLIVMIYERALREGDFLHLDIDTLPKNVPWLFALDQTNDGSIALHGLIETVLSHCLGQVPAWSLCREKVKKALRDIAID